MYPRALATTIVRKLANEGYTAYFAGGWVRDLLMGHPSDDIDIATDAPPEIVLDLFPHTLAIGISFGVVVILSEGHQFEVATFRRDLGYKNGRSPEAVELATPYEDALRRDFTINGMFYDPIEDIIHDFVHGAEDIKRRVIKTIGNPYERFYEDRLRMIRAVRFAARFEFIIDEETQEAIRSNANTLLPAVAMERIWQEFVKMCKYPHFDKALIEMHRLQLLQEIFPELQDVHLNEIKKRVFPFSTIPKETPPILYLMMLFPNIARDEGEDLCRMLKISVAEMKMAQFLIFCRKCVKSEDELKLVDSVEWVHLYASPLAKICLNIVAESLDKNEKKLFLDKHQQRAQELQAHVQRIVEKKPLITASNLISQGLSEGKKMGLLLKEAERIAILENINDEQELLKRLKLTPLWS
jgi:poly(A) polymerase